LLADGHVECWGRGNEGQLGNGALASSHAPERVKGVDDAVGIAAGGGHSCAILKAGGVVCWGLDPKGRPAVPETHACAVLRDGDVACWGENDHAQLGRSGPGGFAPQRIDW
jgi:alpha-tubulin suppressor-like RCC1 family protein